MIKKGFRKKKSYHDILKLQERVKFKKKKKKKKKKKEKKKTSKMKKFQLFI